MHEAREEERGCDDSIECLRRRVGSLRARLPGAEPRNPDDQSYLTIHEAAERLGTTADGAADILADAEFQTDLRGQRIIAEREFERFILARAQGKPAAQFL